MWQAGPGLFKESGMQQSGREIPGDAKALWWTTFHVLLLLTFFEAVACRLHVKKGQTADASEAFIIIIFQVCKRRLQRGFVEQAKF